MGTLIYSALTSLDGYVADREGRFDWAEPDAEVHAAVNDLERPVGTYLYGRRMYEVMSAWETLDLAHRPEQIRDYAEIWRAADKVVYSRTLPSVATARTRLERRFDAGAVRELLDAGRDVSIGGAELAGHAFRSGLIGVCRTFIAPVIVGGGTRALPGGVRLDLELTDERAFANGTVMLGYRVRP